MTNVVLYSELDGEIYVSLVFTRKEVEACKSAVADLGINGDALVQRVIRDTCAGFGQVIPVALKVSADRFKQEG